MKNLYELTGNTPDIDTLLINKRLLTFLSNPRLEQLDITTLILRKH